MKAYTHIASFQRHLSFEVWFTRILINGCLDRQKARTRRSRWLLPVTDAGHRDRDLIEHAHRATDRSPEELLLAREWRGRVAAAVRTLPGRQRLVFLLCHYADHSTRDVAQITGLNESTVRVHLRAPFASCARPWRDSAQSDEPPPHPRSHPGPHLPMTR